MKKEYFEPQLKICCMESCPLMEQTTTDVYNDNPQPPGGALGNSNNMWEEGNTDVPVRPNVWGEE